MENEPKYLNPDFACYNHPDRQATKGCWRCEKLICDECSETVLGRTYCTKCAEEVEQLSSEQDDNILKREIKSPALMIIIIIITLVIAAVEIFIMTR
jgi:hypothetical protein